jgi:hypothetical protein
MLRERSRDSNLLLPAQQYFAIYSLITFEWKAGGLRKHFLILVVNDWLMFRAVHPQTFPTRRYSVLQSTFIDIATWHSMGDHLLAPGVSVLVLKANC